MNTPTLVAPQVSMRSKFQILILIAILICTNLTAQNDLNKLTYSELNKLSFEEYKKGNILGCIPYMQVAQNKAKAEFGTEDSLYLAYTNYLGMYYQQTNDFQKAEPFLIQARDGRAKTLGKEHPLYAESTGNLALMYAEMDAYDKAESLYLEALKIDEKTLGKEHPSYATCLGNLASLYSSMGKYLEAEDLYHKAIQIRAKVLGRESAPYATSLNNLAELYRLISNYAKAEPLLVEAKEIREKVLGKEHPMYAFSLCNLASLYQDITNYESAKPLYLEAKDIFAKTSGKEHVYYATCVNNLALLYKNTNDYKEAEELYIESKNIRAKLLGKQHFDYATSLNNLSTLYHVMSKYEEEELLLLEANRIYFNNLGKEDPVYGNNLTGLAGLYYEMGRLDTAFAYCMASLDAHSTGIDSNFTDFKTLDQYDFYSNLYINNAIKTLLKTLYAQYKKTGDKSKLEQHYELSKAAMRLNEKIRNNFSEEGDKLRVLATNANYVRQGIESALLLEKDTYTQEAFSFAEQNKSILLADAVKGNRARTLGDLPDTLVDKEIVLQKKMATLKKQLYGAKNPEEKAKVSSELNALNLEIDAFFVSIKNKYPKYHALKYENITAKVADVQALLNDKTAFLEYFLTDSMLYLFVVTKKELVLYPILIKMDLLKEKIKILRNALSNYAYILKSEDEAHRDYTETAHWFYSNLVAIAIKNKSLENLIIVTDGELGHLPFETFLVESAPQKKDYKILHYLVNDYNISYNYSATLWKENLEMPKQTNNGQMLACAAAYTPTDSNSLKFRLPYFANLRSHLQPLPAAQLEIADLAKNFQGDFLWNDSTNERFFKENAQNYSIIHLAMHGILDQKQPMISSLAFTENRDSTEDNFLQAFEISRLKLNADLVVLSACETGYGKFTQGEGVVSIARSFMYAGVPSLVVSLWQVNDHSTALIMNKFYQNLADGMSKDAALRQAKMDYIKIAQGVTAHPAFWSPFIQMGDSRPIHVETQFIASKTWWGIIIGGLALLILGAVAMRRKKE